MNKHILFCLVIFYGTFLSQAQNREIGAKDLIVDEFPLVKGKLWIRNPDGIEISSVKFYENDTPVPVFFDGLQKIDSFPQNKSVLFLILNSSNQDELDWYKKVLKEAIRNGSILKGDKIDVISFSSKVKDQLLFPNEINFTDNADEIFARIDKISSQTRSKSSTNRSHIYLSIHEALELYGKENAELPSALFVLADDCALEPIFQVELPGFRSLRLNIPVYGISYTKSKTYFNIKDLCVQTFGLYYRNKDNNTSETAIQLTSFLKGVSARNTGVEYPFTYTSLFEKDGKTHSVKIESTLKTTGFALLSPTLNPIEWIQENPILSTILFILFLALTIILIQLLKKNKIKKIEIELKQQIEISEMQKNQEDSERKLSQQENELAKIKEEETARREKNQEESQQKAQSLDDDHQLRMMLEKGNLPWFQFNFENETGNYQIETPRFSVGRDETNTWRINHPTISRNHFKLNFRDYQYTLMDLGSSNGIFVNGVKVSEVKLKHGDHIQAGDISLTFHI